MPTNKPKVLPKIDPKTGRPLTPRPTAGGRLGTGTQATKPPPLTPRPTATGSLLGNATTYTRPIEETMAANKNKQPSTLPTMWGPNGPVPQGTMGSGPLPRPAGTPASASASPYALASADSRNIGNASAVNAATAGPAYSSVNTGGTGGANTSGTTDPLHGFAKRFTPEMLPYVAAQPELILGELMRAMKLNPEGANSGLYTAGLPYVDALMAILPTAFGAKGPGDSSVPINWIAEMMQQGMTPGGRGIDFGDVLTQLRNVDVNDPQNVLAGGLAAPGMDPIDQINALKQIVFGAAQGGLLPFYQRAVQNMFNNSATSYMGDLATGRTKGAFINDVLGKGGAFARGANF